MLHYTELSKTLQERIAEDRQRAWVNPWRASEESAIRRNPGRDTATIWRPAFVRDVEKILHSPYYNRYTDKTQVFSLYRDDDITRRALHVQLVSRVARNIGSALGLNLDLIEAVALGHDLGHTPFGHAGETFLSDLLYAETGRLFHHNVQSVRVLDKLFCRNMTLQTLDGILCHNGEFVNPRYKPYKRSDYGFDNLDADMQACCHDASFVVSQIPATLEACVVRVCDMIAYLGKDRQDARRARLIPDDMVFGSSEIGQENAEIINNVSVNIIENSYGKDHLSMDEAFAEELRVAKNENYRVIYQNKKLAGIYTESVQPMFKAIYYKLLDDLTSERRDAWVYRHHVDYINQNRRYYLDMTDPANDYLNEEKCLIAADYIASMTDDYFVDLYRDMFPGGKHELSYVSYFER